MLESLLGFYPVKTPADLSAAYYGETYQRLVNAEKAKRESFEMRRRIAPDLVDDVASQTPEVLRPLYWL